MKGPRVESDRDPAPSVSSTLLVGLKAWHADAWQRLIGQYGALVYRWCRQAGLQPDDAADVGQEVFTAVARSITGFRRDQAGHSFRGWLWVITEHKLIDFRRRQAHGPEAVGGSSAQQRFEHLPASDASTSRCPGLTGSNEVLYQKALELRHAFEEATWLAFWRVVVEGHPPAEVAAGLNMTVGNVYVAKSRVLRRLRRELGGPDAR